jgi:DNA-binding response OmpR family regulator
MPKTLLLADGSVTIQRVIELTFTHEDVRVVSVGDGRRAVEWMETERPDIVLADVDVPEVDGYELAAHVKRTARLKDVPVVLLAGAFEPIDQRRADQIGCDGVLIKPFEPQQLVTRVRELLDRTAASRLSHGRGRTGAAPERPAEAGKVKAFPTGGAKPMDTATSTRASHGTLELIDGPETLEIPDRPVWELGLPDLQSEARANDAPPAVPAPPPQKVSLVSAFSALLAAEQSTQTAPHAASAAAPVTEATVEDAVRRVLVKMTDELVRRIVLETAERLIKEEIEKIKSMPD